MKRFTLLREYPVKFGRFLSDMFDELITTGTGTPPLPDPLPSALETFQTFPPDNPADWQFSNLGNVFAYIRKCKRLKIPEEWRLFIDKP